MHTTEVLFVKIMMILSHYLNDLLVTTYSLVIASAIFKLVVDCFFIQRREDLAFYNSNQDNNALVCLFIR